VPRFAIGRNDLARRAALLRVLLAHG